MANADLATTTTEPASLPRRRRKRLFLGGAALLVLAAAGAWYAFLYYANDRRLNAAIAAADRLDPGWRMAELEARRAVLPDEENSAVRVQAAYELLTLRWPAWDQVLGEEDPKAEQERQALQESFNDLQPPYLLSEAQVKALRTELPKVAPLLAEARKVAAMPRGRHAITWTRDFFTTSLAHAQNARNVVRVLDCDVLLRAHDGDMDGAFVSCRAVLNTGRSIGDEQILISQLVRIASAVVALRRIEHTLALGEPPPAALRATQQLVTDEAEQPWFLFGMRGERAGTDGLLELVQNGEIPMSRLQALIGGRSGNLLDGAVMYVVGGSIKANRAAALEFNTTAVELAKLPTMEQRRRFPELDAQARKLPYVARGLCPAIVKIMEAGQRTQAELRCGAAALAAERFRQDKGRWPTAVAELVPAYLPVALADPFDDKPLRIARFDQGIVVYSIGFDGEDNGGKLDRANPRTKGTDLGFRLWDVPHRRQPPRPPKQPDADNP
jgi:hypothetical protein